MFNFRKIMILGFSLNFTTTIQARIVDEDSSKVLMDLINQLPEEIKEISREIISVDSIIDTITIRSIDLELGLITSPNYTKLGRVRLLGEPPQDLIIAGYELKFERRYGDFAFGAPVDATCKNYIISARDKKSICDIKLNWGF